MPFNGSGVFQRLYSWANDKAAGIKIRADRMDNEMNGFATGLSSCITKDGQTTVTANLPMAGYKHTGVANATALTEYAACGQVQNNAFNWCGTAGGTADAITLTPAVAISAYTAGMTFRFVASGTNTVTNPTINVSGAGAKTARVNNTTIPVGAIVSGRMYDATYDGTNFQLLAVTIDINPVTFLDSVFRIQDNADATKQIAFEASGITTGTTRTLTVPDSNMTLVGTATTQTLTNKTLTSPVISTISNTGTVTVPTETGTLALLASDSDARAGTSSTKAIVPSNFVKSLTTSGYIWIGPLLVQWGEQSVATSATVPFPIGFPTACLHVYAQFTTAQSTASGVRSLTTSNFLLENGGAFTATSRWLAIGY